MDDTGRAHEEDIFSMIRSSGNLAELHGEKIADLPRDLESDQILMKSFEQLNLSEELRANLALHITQISETL